MTPCQEAAAQSSWDRHVGQALNLTRQRPEHPATLRALPGEQDGLTAPGPAHPASRALEARQ